MAKEGPRSLIENAKLIHEYETLAILEMERVLKPHALLRQGGSMVLLFDVINATVLRQRLASGPTGPIDFLRIATGTVEIVEELHRHGLLHMNLRPDTILLVQESMEVCLTGFSDSVPIRQSLHATKLEGYPPYLAPERTSADHRPLDGRTDLYALGITFYEMLAGELPFQARDPLEWAHAHIAMQPPSLMDKHGVPEPISGIVSKLLAKSPENRYQSAAGLLADLQRCLEQLEGQGVLKGFPLGLHDIPVEALDAHAFGSTAPPEPRADVSDEPALVLKGVTAIRSEPIRHYGVTPFSDSGYAQMLDLAAVFKATRIFASAGNPNEKVRQLLLLLLEHAGASRGCWISSRQGDYTVELSAVLTADLNWSYESALVPLEHFAQASPEVIQAAAASRTAVCLEDAALAREFSDTEYVRRTRPRSVMCFAIPTNGEESILFYLENHLSANVFSHERLGVLKMIATQLFYAASFTGASERSPSMPLLQRVMPHASILTARELEVLELMAAGLSNKEISNLLVVTAETVKAHVRKIYGKLGVNKRMQAVEAGRSLGLIRGTEGRTRFE